MRLETISEKAALGAPPPGMQEEPVEAPEGLQTAPLGSSVDPSLEPSPEAGEEQPENMSPKDEASKADGAIDAVEKLRSAAAGLDAAAFAMKSDYSDFTLAERIAQVKQELIYIIDKAKEHVEYSAARDPQAKQRVTQWLNT